MQDVALFDSFQKCVQITEVKALKITKHILSDEWFWHLP